MFGYVTADSTSLSKTAKSDYKAAYCGVCRALADRYGAFARFILSFDTTFLSIVLSALSDKADCTETRCPYHLGSKRRCLSGDIADYAADVTVLLAYHNLQDDVNDSASLRAKIFSRMLSKQYKKAEKHQPELSEKIKASLSKLSDAEKKCASDPDLPADIFGTLLGDVFAYEESAREFGFHLGRFIYLCDAACDFKSDIKHGRYNPFFTYRTADFEVILISVINDCLDSYEALPVKYYTELIENVLTRGIWLKYNLKYKRKNK